MITVDKIFSSPSKSLFSMRNTWAKAGGKREVLRRIFNGDELFPGFQFAFLVGTSAFLFRGTLTEIADKYVEGYYIGGKDHLKPFVFERKYLRIARHMGKTDPLFKELWEKYE